MSRCPKCGMEVDDMIGYCTGCMTSAEEIEKLRGVRMIYGSIAIANGLLPKCPKPKGGQLDHWWYIDDEVNTEEWSNQPKNWDVVPCVCGTCGQKMLLDINAPEIPAV